jgi:hypothetical protein
LTGALRHQPDDQVNPDISSTIFAILTFIVVLFQFALALGAPWGSLTMGGRYPGRLPLRMRAVAVAQAMLLLLLTIIVYAKAGVAFEGLHAFSQSAIWGVVAVSSLSLIMNLITPSKWERILWAPVAFGMTICSILLAV